MKTALHFWPTSEGIHIVDITDYVITLKGVLWI